MPLDPRVKRFLDLLAAGNPPDARSATVEERRKGLVSLMEFGGPPPRCGSGGRSNAAGPGRRAAGQALFALEAPASCPDSFIFTAAAWLPAAWRPMTASPARSPVRAACEWCRSTIGWLPSTAFPPPWRTRKRRYATSAGMPRISASTPRASAFAEIPPAPPSPRRRASRRLKPAVRHWSCSC